MVSRLHSRSCLSAFTLLELMVVMLIMGMLLALLLSGISKAMTSVSGVQCRNNLRQLGLALQHYATAHNGELMPVSTFDWNLPPGPNNRERYWFGEITGSGQIDISQGFLVPYLDGASRIKQCPNFTEAQFTLRFQGATSGYGYNYQYLGPGPGMGGPIAYSLRTVKAMSLTVAFADSGRINWWSSSQPVLEENFYLDPPSNGYPNVHFRHSGSANVVFLDGHVESMPPVENALPGYWPAQADALRKQVGLADLSSNDGTDKFFTRE